MTRDDSTLFVFVARPTPLRGTRDQWEALDAVVAHDTYRGAARALGISERALSRRLDRLRSANGGKSLRELTGERAINRYFDAA
jgi:hypothetical protein